MNALLGIFLSKCPQCREGDIFQDGYNPLKIDAEVNKKCPICEYNNEPEPGYFYGSMFISYIWTSFACLGIGGFFMIGLEWSMLQTLIVLAIILALAFVWVLRISRVLYLYIDKRYDRSKYKNVQ